MAKKNIAVHQDKFEEQRQAAFAIWNNFKERLKDEYQIDRAIEDFTGARLQGAPGLGTRMGLCPFHNDTNASMSVCPVEGYFRCHTAGCEARGDVFTFISQYMNVSFKDAVLLAAHRAGIEPPFKSSKSQNWSKSGSKSGIKPRVVKPFENLMNPAKLFESDLVLTFKGLRPPVKDQIFPVWHPGGGRTINPTVKRYKPKMVHIYRNMNNYPLMAVLRCVHRDGGKYFMPIRVGKISADAPPFVVDDRENSIGWIVKGTTPGHRKPIYGMEAAKAWLEKGGKRILIVEGEKTCDATRRMFAARDDADDWLILSPMGGHNASLYADWTDFMSEISQEALSNIDFAVWPDADHIKYRPDGTEIDAQELYVSDSIGAFVTAARKSELNVEDITFKRSLPGVSRENGWDLADAEKENWDGNKVVLEIDDNGTRMSVKKRFMDLEVEITDTGDPAPFEDGPEGDDFALPDLDDVALSSSEDNETSLIPFGDSDDPIVVPKDNDNDTAVATALLLGIDRIVEADEIINKDAEEAQREKPHRENAMDNSHFRSLGFRENAAYFMSLRGGQICCIQISSMKKQNLLGLAPLRYWSECFGFCDRYNRIVIDWDEAMSLLIETAFNIGMWDPQKEAGQGARIDYGRVVFNTGDRLWIQSETDGEGEISTFADFDGEYQYTVGDNCGLPDFDNCYIAGDEDPRALLKLIQSLNWREGSSKMSAMALFGWLCIGSICGVLPWRPHLWLDAQRSAGKTWIINNIIKPTLGKYAILVTSNSTESGLRNILHSCAFPLVFDEAEGEMDGDRHRMASVLRLARHSAAPGESVVAQGVPGGGGKKFYSIQSTFLLSSITPQLAESADKTRFSRARLGPPHKIAYFSKFIETPAAQLLTEDFSSRMIGRMIKRAGSFYEIQKVMVRALTACNVERRMADVWGTYATGAWCLLEDGVPSDFDVALAWIDKTFGILEEVRDVSDEISDDKDHANLFRTLMAYELRCETIHLGVRTFNLGSILLMAIGETPDDDEILDTKQARKRLAEIGIRLGHNGMVAGDKDSIDCLIIHKNSPRISEILSRTPYATSYVDVMQQAENVKNGVPTRFGGLGTYRSVVVPMEHFPISSQEDEHGDQESNGGS